MRFFYLVIAFLALIGSSHAQNVGTSNTPVGPAHSVTNISTPPTAPSSTSAFLMQGLAGSITPTMTGNVLITVSGTIIDVNAGTAGIGIKYQISHGTGAAPGSNTTLAGTQDGVIQEEMNGGTATVADWFRPFSLSVVVTGLTIGTTYWIDLAAEAVATASDKQFNSVSISAVEIP